MAKKIYYNIPVTNWCRLANRDEVPNGVMDDVRRLLKQRKWQLGPLRVDVRRLPNGAVYDIRCNGRLMTTCGFALNNAASPTIWKLLTGLPQLYGPMGGRPRHAPWLSVIVYPPFFDADDLTIAMLQIAQLAIAWALLDESEIPGSADDPVRPGRMEL